MLGLLYARLVSSADPRCNANTVFAEPIPNLTLRHVQIMHRHGMRTPLKAYLPTNQRGHWVCDQEDAPVPRMEAAPSSYYRNYQHILDPDTVEFPPNCRPGDLLVMGMKQHVALGKALADHYVKKLQFIPERFNPSLFKFVSSPIERSFRSLEAMLSGLYPILSTNEVMQIESSSDSISTMYPNTQMCTDLKNLLKQFRASDAYKGIGTKYGGVLADTAAGLGVSTSSGNLSNICDWVLATMCGQSSYPSFLNADVFQACSEIRSLHQWYHYSLQPGVAISYTLREMFKDIDSSLYDSSKPKFTVFSAHDTTVAAYIVSLNNKTYDGIPPYASHVETEIWRDDMGNDHIRVVYNGEPVVIDHFGSSLVKYSEFKEFAQPFTQFCTEVDV